MITYTLNEWREEGNKRFGKDFKKWKFICPKCKTIQTPQDLLDIGVEKEKIDGYIGYSCIGCFKNKTECKFNLNSFHNDETIIVIEEGKYRPMFPFAEEGKLNDT